MSTNTFGPWRKSTKSQALGQCVQARTDTTATRIQLGDSKQDSNGPVLETDRDSFLALLRQAGR